MSNRPSGCQSFHEPSPFSKYLTVATCLVGLGVSFKFLHKTWREWLISAGIRPAPQVFDDEIRAPANAVKTARMPTGITTLNTSTHTIPVFTSHRRGTSIQLRLFPTLLLLTWTLYTLDQILMFLVVILLLWVCPQFNCFARIMLEGSGSCPASTLYSVVVLLQPLGASTFVLLTLFRFLDLFAILSRPRWIALRVGFALVGLVTVLRIVSMFARLVLLRSPQSAAGRALDIPVVYSVAEASYVAFYAIIGLACLVSLAVGVQYVLEVRRNVRDAGVLSSVEFTQPETMTSLTGSKGGLARHDNIDSSETLSPPLPSQSSWAGASIPGLSSMPMVFSQRGRQQQGWKLSPKDRIAHHTRMVLVWIASAIATLATFVAIMLTPAVASQMPTLFLNAFMTLFLRCFSAFVTLSIECIAMLVLSPHM